MKIRIDHDIEAPRWVRNAAMILAPAALLVTATVVRADVPNTFKDGDTLSAQKLNDDFAALDTRLKALEASPAVPSGTIIAFGGEVAPAGWLPCDGTQLDGTNPKFAALYAAIGTAYGGNTTSEMFNLPDLRGRFLRGWDHGAGHDPDSASRAALAMGGNSGDAVGSVEADGFRSHDHGGGDHAHTFATSPCFHTDYVYSGLPLDGNGSYGGNCGDDNSHVRNSGVIIGAQGGSETRPANVAVNYIIKL